MTIEQNLLWLGLFLYVVASSVALVTLLMKTRRDKLVLGFLLAGLVFHGCSIALRWARLEHGPFTNMFEILSSNVWSLLFIFTLSYWRLPAIRPFAAIVLPAMYIMFGWIISIPATDTILPPTYDTLWLYVHIGFGKIFLGALLIATGLAAVILIRRWPPAREMLSVMPEDPRLEELAYRFLLLGLIFDSLMLIAGGLWAQDAWGRYWAWDPLETWSFVSWVLMAMAIHFRLTFKPEAWVNAALIIFTFVISFLTFFGIPFISKLPHQGVV